MRYLFVVLLFCAAMDAAAAAPNPRELASYGFDPAMPLPRVRPIPLWLLKSWSEADQARYAAYSPSPAEMKILASAFAGLPAPMRKTLSERLIGVYFVEGLKGNGITDWALDSSSRTYVYMIYNASGFRQTLTELLTERDLTVFRGKADLSVEAGAGKGIIYTVAHESAHAFDYVNHVTPFTDPEGGDVARGKVIWDVWQGYAEPRPAADYPLRTKLRFYGFGAPELEPARAGELCAQWAASPFASFYGSRSWAEDLAELFVLRHLTQDLHLPLRRICGGKTFEPWENPRVRGRARRLLEPFYR